MFIKNTEIRCALIDVVSFTEEELSEITSWKLEIDLLLYIPFGHDIPPYVNEEFPIISEKFIFPSGSETNVIQETVNETGLSSDQMIIVSKNLSTLKRFMKFSIGTLLIRYGGFDYKEIGYLPDRRINFVSDLKENLTTYLGGYGEIVATIIDEDYFHFGGGGNAYQFQMGKEVSTYNVIAMGRFFNTGDRTYPIHQFSNRIVRHKSREDQIELFGKLFFKAINAVMARSRLNGVMSVPARPGEKNRMSSITSEIALQLGIDDLSEDLTCIEDYPRQKMLNAIERKENVKGKFVCGSNVKDKHILLIDDVFTTGATLNECVHQIMLKGAASVTCFVLGVNQWQDAFNRMQPKCEICNEHMVFRINGSTNVGFFMCTNKEKHDQYSKTYLDVWHQTIKQHAIHPIESDEEIEF